MQTRRRQVSIGTRDLVAEIRAHEVGIAESFRAMAGSPFPEPRQLWSPVLSGERFPLRRLMTMQLAAYRAGRPVEALVAPTLANLAWVRSLYSGPAACVLQLWRAETHANGAANDAQAAFAVTRSDADLARCIERTAADVEAGAALLTALTDERERRRQARRGCAA